MKVEVKVERAARNSQDPVFDGSGIYEKCWDCGEVHLLGWPCYHCTVVKTQISRKDFVSWINPRPPRYLASTDAKCKHCDLWILARMRGQTLHRECKALWAERKRTVFKLNQIIWHIRRRGFYWLDGEKHSIDGLSDEHILVAIGHPLPLDLLYEKKNGGGFRFMGVEFRPGIDHYPWKIPKLIPSILDKKRKYEMREFQDQRKWS